MTETTPDPVLSVTDLGKSFTTAAGELSVLEGISFALGGGESLAVTGPSGSGKSTLLHLIGTLDRPSTGSLRIAGQDPFTLDDASLALFRNQRLGFVFQDHHLLPHYTLLENALLPALAFPTGEGGAEQRARSLLERVGLSERLAHRPAELSGGERQRVAVARALMNRPDVVLCDEPTGNLDRSSAAVVADLLFELQSEERNVLVVVTHSEELASRFERRLEIRSGSVPQSS